MMKLRMRMQFLSWKYVSRKSQALLLPPRGGKFNSRSYMTQRLAPNACWWKAARRSIYNYQHSSRKLSFSLQYFGQDGLQVRIELTFPVLSSPTGIADFGLERLCLLAGIQDGCSAAKKKCQPSGSPPCSITASSFSC